MFVNWKKKKCDLCKIISKIFCIYTWRLHYAFLSYTIYLFCSLWLFAAMPIALHNQPQNISNWPMRNIDQSESFVLFSADHCCSPRTTSWKISKTRSARKRNRRWLSAVSTPSPMPRCAGWRTSWRSSTDTSTTSWRRPASSSWWSTVWGWRTAAATPARLMTRAPRRTSRSKVGAGRYVNCVKEKKTKT